MPKSSLHGAQRSTRVLDSLAVPIVLAPMAGGPSTPELAVAVSRAGGLGFVAAGYLSADQVAANVTAVRAEVPTFGVNVFVGATDPGDAALVASYADRLQPEAERAGVSLGDPCFDDDAFGEKIDLLRHKPVAVVSFTFGLPPAAAIEQLRSAGSEVWLTVTSPTEARQAAATGADALIVQGVEAGGHRGVYVDDDRSDLTLLAALQLVLVEVGLPLVAAGSLMTGHAIAAVLAAGASAAQLGTAYLRTPEAGTSSVQRAATAADTPTVLTRAFSGRTARAIQNRLHDEYGATAPRAYPEINHVTSPLRAHGRKVGDSDVINMWAGQAHRLVESLPAEELTRRLGADMRDALTRAATRFA